MSKVKFTEIISCINKAPTGGFVGITDYVSKDNSVVSVTGRLGCSYGDAKVFAIQALKNAIEERDFEHLIVKGKCYYDTVSGEWNARKKSIGTLTPFTIVYDSDQVLGMAEKILESWETPSNRSSNGVELSDKENGLVFNTETGTFNFALMVDHEYYKEDQTKVLQEDMEVVEKASDPETLVKALIRDRFMKKIKTYTIGEGKFKTLTIGGKKFQSDNITL